LLDEDVGGVERGGKVLTWEMVELEIIRSKRRKEGNPYTPVSIAAGLIFTKCDPISIGFKNIDLIGFSSFPICIFSKASKNKKSEKTS